MRCANPCWAAVGAGNPANETAIFGISLSLIIWALILIVTLKIRRQSLLRADNNGEGGTLALMALAQRSLAKNEPARRRAFAASSAPRCFYGDAMITPALSVLSAIEGLKVATSGNSITTWWRLTAPDPGAAVLRSSRTVRPKVAAFLRPNHAGLVRDHRPSGGLWHVMQKFPPCCGAFNPRYGLEFSRQPRDHRAG